MLQSIFLVEPKVRLFYFLLEDFINAESKKDLEEYKFGVIYIKEKNLVVLKDEQELNKLFNYIPDNSNIELNTSRKLSDKQVKPINMKLITSK